MKIGQNLETKFFFKRKSTCCHFIQGIGKSIQTIEFESKGTDSIQTCKGKESLAL